MYFKGDYKSLQHRIEKMEQEVFETICTFVQRYKRPPSHREIVARTQLRSKSTVSDYLKRLEKKGLIELEPKKHGAIRIVEKNSSVS